MALRLPRIAIDLSGPTPRAIARQSNVLRAGELSVLLQYETAGREGAADRCIPLLDRRWAVGRRRDGFSIWRIVDQEALGRLGHPALLWVKDWWFDPSVDEAAEGPGPAALPLRNQVRSATALEGPRLVIKALASVVAAIRRGNGPVALRVAPSGLASASNPARWFALSLITVLPPTLREALRVSVGEPSPDPSRYDFVVTAGSAEGFTAIDVHDPPGEGDDLVAYFVRNRLMAGDAESVESAAFLHDGEAPGKPPGIPSEDTARSLLQAQPRSDPAADPWGEGIGRILRSAVPGLSSISPELLERDPETAIRALSARVRAGSDLSDDLVADLITATLKTCDPRPWGALAARPAVERARAVGALLARRTRLRRPRPELVRVLASLYPRGADLDPWCSALLGWIREGTSAPPLVQALEEALEDGRGTVTLAARMSLWQELVQALVEAGQSGDATRVLLSPVAADLAKKGAARALAAAWCSIAPSGRDHSQLGAFLDLLRDAPDGPRAIEQLIRRIKSDPVEVSSALAALPADRVGEFTALLGLQPDDAVWAASQRAFNAGIASPRARFVRLAALRHGFPALERVACDLIGPAIQESSFPDPEIAEIALALAQVPGRSGLWPWLAISAAAPERFPPEILEPAVVGVSGEPPETPELLQVAYSAGIRLGSAATWSALDHARWIQLLCTGVDGGEPSAFGVALAGTIVQGIAAASDGIERMVEITGAVGSLGSGEPAARAFMASVLPKAWVVGFPRLYTDRVRRFGLPADVRPLWEQAVAR